MHTFIYFHFMYKNQNKLTLSVPHPKDDDSPMPIAKESWNKLSMKMKYARKAWIMPKARSTWSWNNLWIIWQQTSQIKLRLVNKLRTDWRQVKSRMQLQAICQFIPKSNIFYRIRIPLKATRNKTTRKTTKGTPIKRGDVPSLIRFQCLIHIYFLC